MESKTEPTRFDAAAVASLVDEVPKPTAEQMVGNKPLGYGTAGFRAPEYLLDSVCLRMGMLAALRSATLGVPVGIMVTASHNGIADNGLKLCDGDGGMLHHAWEAYAMRVEKAEGGAAVVAVLREIAAAEGMPHLFRALAPVTPRVVIGRDTRPHSPRLTNLCIRGAQAILGGVVEDLGIVTTPQLHHVVYSANRGEAAWASLDGYNAKVEDAFRTLLAGRTCAGALTIDCAFGVGAKGIAPLVESLKDVLEIKIRNSCDEEGELNGGCGAEFVQKKRLHPANTDPAKDDDLRFASFDGDADRVVFFTFSAAKGGFRLLDGDKIAVLTAQFVGEELEAAGIKADVRMGIVQTAYANGAAHKSVIGAGIECPYAKTGVKFCHHKAVEYDVGIYYEANGHGTAIFKDEIVDLFRARLAEAQDDRVKLALTRLLATAQLYNQAVGDATCDALFVEAVLAIRGWTVHDWDGIYEDLPSRQTKVKVEDRTVVIPLEDETAVTAPLGLKDAIVAAVQEVDAENGRAFARPSGTEDVVRVYAEASTEALADALAAKVATAIYEHAGGVGEAPVAGVWA